MHLIRSWAREPSRRPLFSSSRRSSAIRITGRRFLLALVMPRIFPTGGETPRSKARSARFLARRARVAAPNDSMTITSAAGALLNLGEDTSVLKRMVDDALAHNPSLAFGWMWSGWIRTVSGEAELAIEHFEMSRRLDPRASRRAFHLTGMGICRFWQRRFDQAASLLEDSFDELPTYAMTAWFLAACYAQMERLDEARAFAARQGIVPGGQWLKIGSLYGDPEQRELLLSGLRLATGEQA